MSPAQRPGPRPDGRSVRPRAVGGERINHSAPSLVAVAAQVFNERGYDATSMEDLARAAGIVKSSFYHHVSGKDALLRAALERALDGLFGILDEPAATEGPALERLRHIARRQVEVLTSELPYVTLLLRLRGNTDTERWALKRRRLFDQVLAGLISEAVSDGELPPGTDATIAARLLSGLVNSLVDWYRPGRMSQADLVEAVDRTAFHGLLGR